MFQGIRYEGFFRSLLDPNAAPLAQLQSLGRFILFLQNADGSFVSKYNPDTGPVGDWQSLYYPGEAALGLIALYELHHSCEWLIAAGKALAYLAKRTYNSLDQLTYLSNVNVNASYNYTAGSDNGKVASAYIGGETVTYQYDSLNRLISAAGSSGWGDSYGYDSFGNLLSKTVTAGSAPTLSVSVNPAATSWTGPGTPMTPTETS